jgi:hypothetical protein
MNKKINSEEKKKKQILKSLESTKKELLNTNFKIYNELKCLNKKIQSREIAIKLYIILGFSIIAFDIIFVIITLIKG